MRTIKFRGKRKFGEGWIYGSLVKETCGDIWIFPEDDMHCNAGGDFYSENYPGIGMVDPSTVGQFTGLTDIDGREIYEGDVLHFDERNYRMVWLDNTGGFAALKIGHSVLNPPVFYSVVSFWCKRNLKIIGNIHDNPELVAEDVNIQMKED